jgi:hypothetical protein
MLNPGARLGPYEVIAKLGEGGMGEVYKARDTRLDRTVAIKVLPEALAADPHFRERFDREARVISQLTHQHICTLYDVGEQHGTAYLVMEYLEGQTLEDRLAKGPLTLEHALKIYQRGIAVMGVSVTPGARFATGMPTRLFERGSGGPLLGVGPGGREFVMSGSAAQLPRPPARELVVIQNWTEELKRLLPATR